MGAVADANAGRAEDARPSEGSGGRGGDVRGGARGVVAGLHEVGVEEVVAASHGGVHLAVLLEKDKEQKETTRDNEKKKKEESFNRNIIYVLVCVRVKQAKLS